METAYSLALLVFLAPFLVTWYYPFGCFLLSLVAVIQISCIFLRSLKISSGGKGVLITGCDTGFGHQLAISLNKAGFTVFASCLDDQSEGGKKLASLGSDEDKIHVIKMDVTKQQLVDDAVKYVENNLPKLGLWGLVNNAGVGTFGFVEWVSLEHFEEIAAVNLFGAIRVTKAFVPLIRKSKGRIVNVSSVLGRSTYRFLSAYCVAKHGMEGFSNVLRREMRRFNVKVCTIEPGNFINTTGIIGGIDKNIKILNQYWDNLSESFQESYGRQSVEEIIAFYKGFFFLSAKDIEPVVNAMMDSVVRLYPKSHCLVGSWMDKTLVHLDELLPACIMDRLLFFGEFCSSSRFKN